MNARAAVTAPVGRWTASPLGGSSRRALPSRRGADIVAAKVEDIAAARPRPILIAQWVIDADGRLACQWRVAE
jgi:hypothetical protein